MNLLCISAVISTALHFFFLGYFLEIKRKLLTPQKALQTVNQTLHRAQHTQAAVHSHSHPWEIIGIVHLTCMFLDK